MPYIGEEKRSLLDPHLAALASRIILDDELTQAGVLNYCITSLLTEILNANGVRYQNINELIGVLECAKLELYRRVASPYEDKKKDSNGDVY